MARFCPSRGFILDLGGMGVCCSILFCPRLQLQAINRSVSALETCLFFIQADCWLQDAKTCPPPFCFTVQCIPPPPTFSTNVVRDVEKHAGSGAVSGLSDHETISMHQYLKSYDVPSRKLNSSKLPAFPCAGYCTLTTLRIEKGDKFTDSMAWLILPGTKELPSQPVSQTKGKKDRLILG